MQEKGRTVFSSSSEKTKMSNHLQISEQRYHILFSNFKTVITSVGPVRGVNYRPPTQQYGALLNDLTIFSYYQPTLTEFQVSNILNEENVSAVIDNWSSNVRRRQSNDTPFGLFILAEWFFWRPKQSLLICITVDFAKTLMDFRSPVLVDLKNFLFSCIVPRISVVTIDQPVTRGSGIELRPSLKIS